MQRVHASPMWREFAARMMYEDTYMNSADFAHYLQVKRNEMVDFLQSVGLMQKQ